MTLFAYRWQMREAGETLVEFTLSEGDGGTRLHVRESGFASLNLPAEERKATYDSHTEGWGIELGHLEEHARTTRCDRGRLRRAGRPHAPPGAGPPGDARRGVGDRTLAADLPVSRVAVIKHLAVLDRAGLVKSRRAGREVRFSVRPEQLQATAAWLSRLAADWDSRLNAIKRLAEG